MTFALLCIFITILWIVLGTSLSKLHPFLVLFSAALLLAVLLGLPLMDSLNLIQSGFGQIVQKIGLLILFGTVIGVAMEQSGATLSIARGILKIMKIKVSAQKRPKLREACAAPDVPSGAACCCPFGLAMPQLV